MDKELVSVELKEIRSYQFEARFGDGVPDLVCDEPPPLGAGAGPSPVQLLAAAVGNCLSDSLTFAFKKYKQEAGPLSVRVVASVGRNETGRLRVLQIEVWLKLGVLAGALMHVDRVLAQFEAFCTVTQSVGQGIPIALHVQDVAGQILK
ncbi:MAG: OsmC family protein [Burkholderiaceae bacterium]|nr:OsmC family protein [Burkholderiaceae bacterium]